MSVVIPVFNSAATLPKLVARLSAALSSYSDVWEAILVDDGSVDDSWHEILSAAALTERVHGVRLMRNCGQHNALLAGIRRAQYPIVATIDDDLQNPPEEIPRLIAALTPELDVIYGTPARAEHGFSRRILSWTTKVALQRALGADVATKISAFRVFRRSLRDGFAAAAGPSVNLDVLLSWSTTRVGSLPVQHDPRTSGRTTYTVRRLVRHALNMLTGFSTVPLRIASFIGFAFALIGVAILFYVIVRYLQSGGVVPGFAFLASVITIFAGAQLFTIGIIGEYLARMYQRLLDKPSYVIAEICGAGAESGPG